MTDTAWIVTAVVCLRTSSTRAPAAWWRVLAIALMVPTLSCRKSDDCVDRPQQTLLQSTFTELGANAVTSYSFQVPANLPSPVGVHTSVRWTPRANSTLLVVSDHACSHDELTGGTCSLTASTGQEYRDLPDTQNREYGLAQVSADLRPGTTGIVYVVNLGPQTEAGTIEVTEVGVLCFRLRNLDLL